MSPHSIFIITAISTRKTKTFKSEFTDFSYKSIKNELFFGYTIEKRRGITLKIASPEKTIIDYFYLNNQIRSRKEIMNLRINTEQLKEISEKSTILKYAKTIRNKRLQKQIQILLSLQKYA